MIVRVTHRRWVEYWHNGRLVFKAEIDCDSLAQRVPGGLSIKGPNHEPYFLMAPDGRKQKTLKG